MLGLMQHRGSDNAIRARNLKLGGSYALALSTSMKHLPNTQTVELPGNRLGKDGGTVILSSLVDRVKTINLDHNKIGNEGMQSLITWIDTLGTRCVLEELSLENNNLGDALVIGLAEALIKSQVSLVKLNLSHNNI